MPRISPVQVATAKPEIVELFAAVKKKMGMVPNLISTMANAPVVANAYLGFSGALAGGNLPAKLREQIALSVGQANSCNYCVAAHSLLGKMAGLHADEIIAARQSQAADTKTSIALQFAQKLVNERGHVTDADLATVRQAGFSDGDITEIVANVALNIFTNYINHVADTTVDFPSVPTLQYANS